MGLPVIEPIPYVACDECGRETAWEGSVVLRRTTSSSAAGTTLHFCSYPCLRLWVIDHLRLPRA
jgi:hypothetical protein